ncbi:hypothetical protein AN639_01485 [Candidatus Epulonipiscium fishelsonii]|uniref:Uncharacterized protein n=1 Tax=Candidatus Epulonipiscium fishelsonii TaxID=77094 RepID=A0ACC8XBF3_9FIRM|nr:hypothetical protein AN639_01485 [Epulopiscium sp. SCG-B05WGA-EpuloA1]ONI39998.1 hypothetical protein AN396_06520 [Epulopiscium sp. SCG-B11WGA-EpuloA1]
MIKNKLMYLLASSFIFIVSMDQEVLASEDAPIDVSLENSTNQQTQFELPLNNSMGYSLPTYLMHAPDQDAETIRALAAGELFLIKE